MSTKEEMPLIAIQLEQGHALKTCLLMMLSGQPDADNKTMRTKYLPIEKIDDVFVDSFVQIIGNTQIEFIVESKRHSIRLYSSRKVNNLGLLENDLLNFSFSILGDLRDLRLDQFGGLTPFTQDIHINKSLNELFKGLTKNIQVADRDCAVCYEFTNTLTPCCRHSLCYRCWFRIEELCINIEAICPLCRSRLT